MFSGIFLTLKTIVKNRAAGAGPPLGAPTAAATLQINTGGHGGADA